MSTFHMIMAAHGSPTPRYGRQPSSVMNCSFPYVESTKSTTGNHDDLTAFVGVLRQKPCSHAYEDFATLRPDVELDGHHTPGSCGTCLTDWEAIVHHRHNSGNGDDKVGWEVTLISFHQLGSCRSPDEWKWANLAKMPSKARPPGSVRRKWTPNHLVLREKNPTVVPLSFSLSLEFHLYHDLLLHMGPPPKPYQLQVQSPTTPIVHIQPGLLNFGSGLQG